MNTKSFVKTENLNKALRKFYSSKPFPFIVIDNFLDLKFAKKIEKNFPNFNNKNLWSYKNYCEIKKATDNWNLFPPEAYQLLHLLNSNSFLENIRKKIRIKKLYPDFGLNGGGFHIMGHKGKLNPHLDYIIHPKLNLMRKLNLIIFFNLNWKEENGGELCLYEKNLKNKKLPGKLIQKIEPKFNRAVLFDTSMNSWHGVNEVKKMIRKSLAVYYLVDKKLNTEKRYKALYSPLKNQMQNQKVKKFISMRANPKFAFKVAKI